MILRKATLATVLGLGTGGGLLWATYLRDIRRAYARVRGKSSLISSPYGAIEYKEGGRGAAVLVCHGSGGGYDQGELLAETLLADGFRWIAPSRFGYLRSTCHEGATFDDQAHAYAALLDRIGVDKVAVVALSHGGPSALLFALLHPERTSSLTLVSAGVATTTTDKQGKADQKGSALTALFQRDWLYWLITRFLKKQFLGLMGASGAVIAGLTSEQMDVVERVIEQMNPVRPRAAGVAFDNRARLPGERIKVIQAPTLVIHATDDLLQIYENAEFAASTIPDARLLRFERGGHLLLAVDQPAIRIAVKQHILTHAQNEASG